MGATTTSATTTSTTFVVKTAALSSLKKFRIHPRVARWETTDINTLKNFPDYQQGEKIYRYSNLSDEDCSNKEDVIIYQA